MLSNMTIEKMEVQMDSLAKCVIKSTRQILLKLYYEVCVVCAFCEWKGETMAI